MIFGESHKYKMKPILVRLDNHLSLGVPEHPTDIENMRLV
jgi:hypothetical protein